MLCDEDERLYIKGWMSKHCGLKYRKIKFRTHSESECFDVPILEGMISYSSDHSKTEPVNRNPRWRLFGLIWNGRDILFWNSIQNPNNFWPFEIQTCSAFKPPLYNTFWSAQKSFISRIKCTVGIRKLDMSGFWMVDLRSVFKWSSFQMF